MPSGPESITTPTPNNSDPIPFVDLQLQQRRIAEEVDQEFRHVMESCSFVLGPHVSQFERDYAQFAGVAHCVGVANGTDAIELALRASGVSQGSKVLIPANTFVATAEAVLRSGCKLELADCGDDFLIDSEQALSRVSRNTHAVIGVDLYGQIAPFEELAALLNQDIQLIEDAAQSQGAARHGAVAGSLGVAAATSFYPGKNLGAFGDAGAVTTSRREVADNVRALRNHGGIKRYEHEVIGVNSRLDSLQAAVLSIKLRRLHAWNGERIRAAKLYDDLLRGIESVTVPRVRAGNTHVFHLYVVRTPRRDRVIEALQKASIGTGIHYPLPIHLLPAFSQLGYKKGDFPVAEKLSREIVSLPIFPGITQSQQHRVVEVLVAAS